VECVADQLWLVADGKCTPFDDDLDAYRKFVIKQRKLERDKTKPAVVTAVVEQAKPDNKGLERKAQELEARIADMQKQQQLVEGEIAEACAPGQDQKRLAQLNQAFARLQQDLVQAEADLALVIGQL